MSFQQTIFKTILTAMLGAVLLLLVGCGQKGDLYLKPQPSAAVAPHKTTA